MENDAQLGQQEQPSSVTVAPTFSVVIPVYNRAHIIAAALDSLVTQSFQDFEVIIIDDGSSDSEALQAVLARYPADQYRYFRYANAGASTARNRGIEQARGRYVAFLDSDDQFRPGKLEKVNAAIAATPADIYFAFANFKRSDAITTNRPSRAPYPGETIESFVFCALEPIQTTTIVVDAAKCKAYPFVNGLKKYEEAIFLVNLVRNGCNWHFIPELLTEWNDEEVENRLGSRREAKNMSQWYRNNQHMLSSEARAGFRSNVLSYEYGWRNPFKVIIFIGGALLSGHIGLKRSIQSLSRALLPQPIYRAVVNQLLLRAHKR